MNTVVTWTELLCYILYGLLAMKSPSTIYLLVVYGGTDRKVLMRVL
jgi:hypothetical protein